MKNEDVNSHGQEEFSIKKNENHENVEVMNDRMTSSKKKLSA